MSTTNPTNETVSTDDAQPTELTDRAIRALLTSMTVIDNCGDVRGAEGMFEVTTDSGSEYIVDLETESCTCPDHEYRGVRCKHIRRVEFEIGVAAIPGDVNLQALDDQLGEHVTEGEPRIVMTDGGMQALEGCADAPTADGGDPRDDYIHIGIDAKGGAHCYRTTDETVFAIGGGEIAQRYDVSERSVNDWIAYVDDRRGWDSQNLFESMADALGGAI